MGDAGSRKAMAQPTAPEAEVVQKRRRELGLLQREVAKQIGIAEETFANWEKDRTTPVASQFRPVVEFLGFDPSPPPRSLAGRLEAKRRALGATFDQIAQYLGWDHASLYRYVPGIWRIKPGRVAALEAFLAATPSELGAVLEFPRRRR
jgi:transcriptional regulator with XRE-family HTH domain